MSIISFIGLQAQCVAHASPCFGPVTSPHLLWAFVPSPLLYQSLLCLVVHLYSSPLSLLTSAEQPLQHSAEKLFFLTQFLWGVSMCVSVY